MLKRELLRLLPQNFQALRIDRASMALNNQLFSARLCSFSQFSGEKESASIHTKTLTDRTSGSRVLPSNALSLKSCLDRHDGVLRRAEVEIVKANPVAPCRRPVHDSELFVGEVAAAKTVNGNGACRQGKCFRFPKYMVPEKLVVAVDVDEVLGSFLTALNRFIADRYSLNHSVSEYYVYEFFKIWKCSRAEADFRVHEFFKTTYFQNGIHPIPGAQHALRNLSSFCILSVVTSRQNVIKDHTLEWIQKHYPDLFQEIHFGNHFALDGESKPKSEICRQDLLIYLPICRISSLGAQILIDDNPRYASECADAGMRVLLFDYDNSYPWCKTGVENSHPLVTKVHNWEEVEQLLVSWVASST
ncbi:hypothetical protein ACMD2_16423 [Ananas comosus]|uniref:Uncharacterized protein n=1 Tax=Ananas comosus TaxID=4615 RepID=A0A199V7K5_ANACO|nr:hypothetical protein ACMD2_16423 [Ananas comosus]